jgi:hypothetical protein
MNTKSLSRQRSFRARRVPESQVIRRRLADECMAHLVHRPGPTVKANRMLINLAARMGLAIAVEQAIGINRGIDLGGGQGSVAEQFLDGAQVATATEQMGSKGMA